MRPTPLPPSLKQQCALGTLVTLPQGPPSKARPPLVGSEAAAQVAKPPPVLGETSGPRLSRTSQAPILVRAKPPPSVFIMPGLDIVRGSAPATPPTAPRRPLSRGATTATGLPRNGPPMFFEDQRPAGWKLVMGDLPADVDATQVLWMTM